MFRSPLGWLDPVLDTCRDRILSSRSADLSARTKSDGSRVTDLDVWVERRIVDAIRRECPEAGIFSEETYHDQTALGRDVCFVIDPIDGTKEMLAGGSDFSISVCMFRSGRPAAGTLDVPASDRRFTGLAGAGMTLNGRMMRLKDAAPLRSARLAASPTQLADPSVGALLQRLPVAEIAPVGAITPKIARVLANDCNLAVFLPSRDKFAYLWDFAAVALLLSESGGSLISFAGADLLVTLPLAHEGGWIAGRRELCNDLRRACLSSVGEPPIWLSDRLHIDG